MSIECAECEHDLRGMVSIYDHSPTPPLTASLDAVVALIGEKLPGWKWGMHQPVLGTYRGYVSKPSPFRPMPVTVDATTAALALLAATLRALSASTRAVETQDEHTEARA